MMNAIMVYFDEHSWFELILLWIDGVLATGITMILVFSPDRTVGHSNALTWYERAVRFVLTAAYAVLAVRVWAGWFYTPVEPTQVAVNALVFAVIVMARGDVAVILRSLKQVRSDRQAVLTADNAPEDTRKRL